MAMRLDAVVPLGRTLREYELMFALSPPDYAGGVLDCGGGPASFAAEAAAAGRRVIALDPLYVHGGGAIRERFDETIETVPSQVRATIADWVWSVHRSPEELEATRRAAMARFASDYAADRGTRYVAGELPRLPFSSDAFGLAVCSHLLFLYSDQLSSELHVRAVRELCRVAREVRIFPLLSLAGAPSPHVAPVRTALARDGLVTDVVRVPYELQRGGNEMLRVRR